MIQRDYELRKSQFAAHRWSSAAELPVRWRETDLLLYQTGWWVPKIAAIVSRIGSWLSANTEAASAIRSVPTISNTMRPKRSATVVITIVITAPPPQRRWENPADRGWAQPRGVEIEPENNRKKPVGKGTDTAGGKEHPTITRQRSEPH